MVENQDQINEVISIDKEQKLIDQFDCLLLNLSPIQGHFYLSENSIYFMPDNKNEENNIKINMDEMTHLGLKDENLKIEIKDMKKTYSFSFKETNNVYKKLKSRCKIYNKKTEKSNNIVLSDSEELDNEDNIKTASSSNKCSLNSSSYNDDSLKNAYPFTEKKNSLKSLKDSELKKIKRYNSTKCIIKDLTKILSSKEEKEEEKPIIKENIEFKKIDPELDHELNKKIINLPPSKLFEKYFTQKNEDTSYEAYYKWSGEYSEIKIIDWEKINNDNTKENKDKEIYKRKENFCISLVGVPLVNKSSVEKTMEYWIDNDGTYYIHSISYSQGVPLSDKFNVETMIEFHPYMNNTKTVLRAYVRTNILKWSLFKFALISQGKKNYAKEVDTWIKFIEEKGDKIEGDY